MCPKQQEDGVGPISKKTPKMFETNRYYELPKLGYDYKDLAPYMSEEQLRIHHSKHHKAYVDGANAIVQKMERARTEGIHLDMRATLKDLSFNIGGRLLHSLFWNNLMPNGEDGKELALAGAPPAQC